ncbi:MAG: RrF2 family transcriptional regulator [Dethiobacteria bacterium]|nr:Rrf2 family transcriptional regulator [Bacillota bacterium]MDW7729913.1 Rrf2 family transcriptional regulator [Bacillota bacterium]
MQITRQAEYAIRIMLELATLPTGKGTQSKVIAEKRKVPDKFLQKTIQILVRTGYVATKRGTMGGVKLAVTPESVTIADVITAIEGKVFISPCLCEGFFCGNKEKCQVTKILQRAQNALLDELSKETLADLVRNEGRDEVECLVDLESISAADNK